MKTKHYTFPISKKFRWRWWEIECNWMSFQRYFKNVNVDIAKGRSYPHLRGGILPSIDTQEYSGFAVNWFGFRLRLGLNTNDRGWIPKPTRLRLWLYRNNLPLF